MKNVELGYKYENENLLVNDKLIKFPYSIKCVEKIENMLIVLLGMPKINGKPYNVGYLNELIELNQIDNLYAINYKGEIIWRSKKRKESNPEPYVDIKICNSEIFAYEFIGRRYSIDINNGNILEMITTK